MLCASFTALRRPTLVITLAATPGQRTVRIHKTGSLTQCTGQGYLMDATQIKHCGTYPFVDTVDEADACITMVLSHWAPDDYFKQEMSTLKEQEKLAKLLMKPEKFVHLLNNFKMPSYAEVNEKLKEVTKDLQKV